MAGYRCDLQLSWVDPHLDRMFVGFISYSSSYIVPWSVRQRRHWPLEECVLRSGCGVIASALIR